MASDTDDDLRARWLDRLHAVSRAQARYLYTLLVLALFFWSLRSQIAATPEHSSIKVPLVGLAVDSHVVLASGPIALSLTVLAMLGTFPAVERAYKEYKRRSPSQNEFEAIDTNPNAIDLAVYSRQGSKWGSLGLISYPLVLSLVVFESVVLLVWLACSEVSAKIIFFPLGVLVTMAALPRLLSLWWSKLSSMRSQLSNTPAA